MHVTGLPFEGNKRQTDTKSRISGLLASFAVVIKDFFSLFAALRYHGILFSDVKCLLHSLGSD